MGILEGSLMNHSFVVISLRKIICATLSALVNPVWKIILYDTLPRRAEITTRWIIFDREDAKKSGGSSRKCVRSTNFDPRMNEIYE